MNSRIKIILVGILAAQVAAHVWAATPINSCPFLISGPGNYLVTADLTCVPNDITGNAGITINSSNVTLNLNGHTISGVLLGTAVFVVPPSTFPSPARLDHVGISGPGLIQNFGTGIRIKHTDFAQVTGVTVTGAGTAIDQSYAGIFASDVKQLTLGYNIISHANLGVNLGEPSVDGGPSVSGTVTSNQVAGNATGILLSAGSGNVINGNIVSGNSVTGILIGLASPPVDTTRVYSNTASGNGIGIAVGGSGSFGNQIFGNTSVGNFNNDLDDIHGDCANFFSNNVFFKSPLPCIH